MFLFRKILIIVFLIILVGSFFSVKVLALEAGGLNESGKEAGFKVGGREMTITEIIGFIIKTILSFLGVIFFISTFIAGYAWMTAGGSSEIVDKAKARIVNSIIGIIVILLAYVITGFVFENF